MNYRFRIAALLALGVCWPALATSQLVPGGRALDVDLQRAQFNQVMIKAMRELTAAWQDGWPPAGGPNRIVEHYAEEATLLQLGGALVSGSAAVRAVTDSLRTRIREVALGYTDFEASEGIAYFYGVFTMQPRTPTAAEINGHHFTILKRGRNGLRIRMQTLHGTGDAALPQLPATHPGGPLTVDAMANNGTLARYRNANDLINGLHLAWARADSSALLNLFHGDALIQLPGQAAGSKGTQAFRDLLEFKTRSRALHFLTLDFDGAGRISALLGRYVVELPGEKTIEGYFALVLTGDGIDWRIRSLLFL
jgi:hypothetical protein